MRRSCWVGGALTGVFLFALGALHAQQATPKAEPYVPKQSDRPSALHATLLICGPPKVSF